MSDITLEQRQDLLSALSEPDTAPPGYLRWMFRFVNRSNTRRLVMDLSDEQISDAGIDRASVLGNKPILHVDARTTTYLHSLR
jgi:uncharacterized protein YjiS (DUF1127 family)